MILLGFPLGQKKNSSALPTGSGWWQGHRKGTQERKCLGSRGWILHPLHVLLLHGTIWGFHSPYPEMELEWDRSQLWVGCAAREASLRDAKEGSPATGREKAEGVGYSWGVSCT